MEVSIKFTQKELEMIARALVFGIIHTNDEKEEMQFKALEAKISIIGQLGATTNKDGYSGALGG